MIAVHLGIVDEEQIDNMSYIFFEEVLEELGHKLTYDAIVNYAGNSFCEKSWDMIVEHNPLNSSTGEHNKKAMNSLAGFFNSASSDIKIGKPQIKGKKK